jgi:AraC-like DNA-binding protein
MNTVTIDRLLCLLDVQMHALALCEVSHGTGLRLPGMEAVLVHYILEGSGVLILEDGTTVAFGPDTLIFLPPGASHDMAETRETPSLITWKDVATPLGDGMMRFATEGPSTAILSACGTISADCGGLDLFERLREPVCEDLSGSPVVRSAFELMLKEMQGPRFGTRPLAEALMKQCLILAVRNQIERGEMKLMPVFGLRDPRLVQALLAMMEDPARDHSLEDLAKQSGMSRSLFAERFAEAFQRPAMDLLKQIRLHRSAQLLRGTNLPVQMIALTVGYASRSYFSRAFKDAYGADPKTFRDEARSTAHPKSSRQEARSTKETGNGQQTRH